MQRAIPCLVLFLLASCVLVVSAAPGYDLPREQRRQLIPSSNPVSTSGGGGGGGGATTTPAVTTSAAAPTTTKPAATTTTPQAATTTTTPATTQQQQQSTTNNQPSTTAAQQTTANQQSTTAPSTGPTTASNAPSITNGITSTPSSAGGTQTLTQTLPDNASSTSAAPSTSGSTTSGSSSSGLGTGSIIGLSVAGGVAAIGVIAFFVWKFTRKRFTDFDDNEAIKWPELNSHGGESVSGHALPTHATGRAGFGDDDANSTLHGGYASSVATTSTPDLYPAGTGADPYAVPPLPHLNPNQPYRDDVGPVPGYGDPNGFYDPYRGPVPNTLNDAEGGVPGAGYGAEAIPMTQMTRSKSPGPQMGYDPSMMGRQSPAPQLGRQSPGPQLGYGGQMMEAPGRQPSPGPRAAYGGDGYR